MEVIYSNKTQSVRVASAQYPIDFFTTFSDWQIKIEKWTADAVQNGAEILLFPEYGMMELTSLFSEEERRNLKKQAFLLKEYLDDFLKTFKDLAVKYGVYIIAPSFPVYHSENLTTNRVHVFSKKGTVEFQDKFYMTRFESEDWNIKAGLPLIKVFHTERFNFSISTCFDVEFSFPAMAAAQSGAHIVFSPSCTETLKGANRVHIGARARGLENQIYVVVSQTIGEAKWSPAVDLNYGYAGFYCTPDVGFSDDGIICLGEHNQPKWLIQDLRISHLNKVRSSGAVLNYKTHENIFKSIKSLDYFPIQSKIIQFKD